MRKYGTNAPKEIKTKGFCEQFCEEFSDPILRILIVASIAALITGVIKDGFALVRRMG